MKRYIKHTSIILVAFLLMNFSYAQDFKFTAAASSYNVKTGDRFQIQYTVNSKISNFKAPNLKSFRVLSTRAPYPQVSIVNGRTSYSISYNYVLMAIKEGVFTITPAVAVANGKSYKTKSLKITVGKGVKVQQNPGVNQNNSPGTKATSSKELFIKSSVNKSKVYQGEQIICTYKIYFKVSIAGVELIKNADLNGFWSQEIDIGQMQQTTEIINGVKWNVATVRQIVLFPQRAGKLEIDPIEMNFVVQKRTNGRGQSVFDQLFGRYENKEYALKSKPIYINVKPHPTTSEESFTGSVGNLDMKVDVSTNELKENEAVNIKVKISGKGNINLIDELDIKFPSDFETYDPKVNDNIQTTANGVSGSREFDYLVIPRHAGKFTIEPIQFTYFNPKTKKYKTITSKAIELNVLKGDGSASNVVYSSANKEDIKMLGEDIRYIHTSTITISHTNTSLYNSLTFYLLLTLAPILFLLTFIFRNKIRVANDDVIGMKKKKANKVATKLLKAAKESLSANNKNEFYDAISKALFGYIGDKLNIEAAALNQNNIKEKLITIEVSESTIASLIETIELCDMARFAPVSVSDQDVYDKAENIINKIEEEVS